MPRSQSSSSGVEVNGYAIRELRQRLSNPDIFQLADTVGVDRSYITKLELGSRRRASHRVFNALCDALGVHDRRVLMADPYKCAGPVDDNTFAAAV